MNVGIVAVPIKQQLNLLEAGRCPGEINEEGDDQVAIGLANGRRQCVIPDAAEGLFECDKTQPGDLLKRTDG